PLAVRRRGSTRLAPPPTFPPPRPGRASLSDPDESFTRGHRGRSGRGRNRAPNRRPTTLRPERGAPGPAASNLSAARVAPASPEAPEVAVAPAAPAVRAASAAPNVSAVLEA